MFDILIMIFTFTTEINIIIIIILTTFINVLLTESSTKGAIKITVTLIIKKEKRKRKLTKLEITIWTLLREEGMNELLRDLVMSRNNEKKINKRPNPSRHLMCYLWKQFKWTKSRSLKSKNMQYQK